ncbi:MAG: LamG domain-containing protein, partial [Gammaproteobacteria bacterium]
QVVVPHNDQLSPTKAITMSAWIYNDAAALFDSYRIISKESLGSNDNYFLSLGSNQLYMGIGGEFFMPGVDFQTDIWYHVAGTYDDDADEIRMYIDGIEVLVESTSVQLVANNDSIYIGSNWEEYKWWEGLLDDVRLYNRALTATEIEEVFNTAPSEGSDDGGGSKAIPDPPSDTCSGNYLDEFNINDSYAGNDGSLTWANDWQEVNESDGAKSGDEQVTTDGSNIYILQIRDNDGGGEGVEREADLSDYLNATLNFDYRRKGLDNSDDYVMIELSFNGNLWTEIDRITGPGTDTSYQTFSKDISSFISTNTKFRFRTSSKNGGTDTVFFDNVQIGVSGCVE